MSTKALLVLIFAAAFAAFGVRFRGAPNTSTPIGTPTPTPTPVPFSHPLVFPPVNTNANVSIGIDEGMCADLGWAMH